MTKDCNVLIDQDAGDLAITFDITQCTTCPEPDCDGKQAAMILDGPCESEPIND